MGGDGGGGTWRSDLRIPGTNRLRWGYLHPTVLTVIIVVTARYTIPWFQKLPFVVGLPSPHGLMVITVVIARYNIPWFQKLRRLPRDNRTVL